MKKLILCLSILLLFTGCTSTLNTPTERVEEFLGKYQSMDSEVLAQLDSVISSEDTMSDDQKKEYRALMEKQYQNLSYKIKNEKIEGDNAIVDVEIEVYDYATSITKSKKYYDEHPEEFRDVDAKATMDTSDDDVARSKDDDDNATDADTTKNHNAKNSDATDNKDSKYIDYKIKQMKSVTDKVKYELTFNLVKEDGKWKVEDISDIDRQKIHGLFEK